MPRSAGTDAIELTDRDYELLVSLLKYRYLTTSQIQRLHFPSEQTTARRLRLLEAAGFVKTSRTTASPERLASLGRRGAEAVAERLAMPFEEVGWDARREQPKDYLFLRHFIAVSDFCIALTQACADKGPTQLLGFIPEHVVDESAGATLKKHIRDVITDAMNTKQKISHTPDAVFALKRGDSSALFFLEVDRGTEVLSNPDRGLLKTIRFYLSMLVAGGYQRYQAEFGVDRPFRAFRALFVFNSAERLNNVREICGRAPFKPEHARRFLWLATEDALIDSNLLQREWVSLDPEDARPYALSGRGSTRVGAATS
jgi:hypothetical protein